MCGRRLSLAAGSAPNWGNAQRLCASVNRRDGGWHTTGKNEESLVILQGQGDALIEGEANRPFVAPAIVYIPPETRHNIRNTGSLPLEYVYVVAPAKK